jgi:hypothetical protein
VGKAEQPFEVSMPTPFDSNFKIRDFGPGLSPNDVKNIYTVYFSSTRNHSDEFTGCLGLGSKSPFAYRDSFTVTSWHGGKKYVYSLFKNEENCPAIASISEENSSEPSGVEISISVKSHDIHKFKEVARKVYYFFKLRPNIHGVTIDFSDINPVIDTDIYTIFKSDNSCLGNSISVQMGQVVYSAQSNDDIRGEVGLGNNFNYHYHLVLKASMGSCSIAASREELQFDTKTVAHVKSMFRNTLKDLEKRITDELAQFTCTFDKVKHLCKWENIVESVVRKINIKIPHHTDAYVIDDIYVRNNTLTFANLAHINNKHFFGSFGTPNRSNTDNVYEDCNYVFIDIGDANARSPKIRAKIRAFVERNTDRSRYYWATVKDYAAFKNAFGCEPIKAINLPDPVRDPNAISSNRATDIKEYNHLLHNWLDVRGPLAKDAVIVCRNRHDFAMGNTWTNNIRGIIKILGVTNVYSMSSARYDKMKKVTKLTDLAKKYITDRVNKMTEEEESVYFGSLTSSTLSNDLVNKAKGLDPLFKALYDYKKLREKADEDRNTIIRLCSLYNINPKHPIRNYDQEIYKKYPLLEFCTGEIPSEHMIEYIKLKGDNS